VFWYFILDVPVLGSNHYFV